MPVRFYGTSGHDHFNHSQYSPYSDAYTMIYAYGGADTIIGSDFGSYIEAGSGNDFIVTHDGADTIYGQGDDDLIILGAGDDYVDGGSGEDLVFLGGIQVGARVDLSAGTITAKLPVYSDYVGEKTVRNVENVTGTQWTDDIIGNAADNVVNGLGGNDTFDLGAGDDIAEGGAGNNVFYEGAGDDHYDGEGGYDRLNLIEHTGSVRLDTDGQTLSDRYSDGPSIGSNTFNSIESFWLGEGDDYVDARGDTIDNIYAWRGDDTVVIGRGDIADGVSGQDTIFLQDLGAGAWHDLELGQSTHAGETVATYKRFETFEGGNDADNFTGSISGKSVFGNGGSDFFNFERSSELRVYGGNDLDIFSLDNVSGSFHGEQGHDVFSLDAVSTGALRLDGGGGNDALSIGLTVDAGFDGFRIDASAGTMTALFNNSVPVIEISGFETFSGSNSDDIFIGSAVGEFVSGGNGDDRISGGGGTDKLFGSGGNDTVIGGQGADIVFGGRGNDLLTGGTDSETFLMMYDRYGDGAAFGSDMIVDFDARPPGFGGDVLQFVNNGDGLDMRRLDGRIIDSFGDLDTNGDGVLALGDMGVTAHESGITLGFDSGFLSLDGVDYLSEASFDFGMFDLYA